MIAPRNKPEVENRTNGVQKMKFYFLWTREIGDVDVWNPKPRNCGRHFKTLEIMNKGSFFRKKLL